MTNQSFPKREELLNGDVAAAQGYAYDLREKLLELIEMKEQEKNREILTALKDRDVALAKLETIEDKAEDEKELAVIKVKRHKQEEIANVEKSCYDSLRAERIRHHEEETQIYEQNKKLRRNVDALEDQRRRDVEALEDQLHDAKQTIRMLKERHPEDENAPSE